MDKATDVQCYKISLSAEKTYVYVNDICEKITLDLAVSFTHDFTTLGNRQGVTRVLINVWGTSNISGVFGMYEYAYKLARRAGLTSSWRIALVRDAGDDSYDFLETVMTNAGHKFKLLVDEEKALAWLLHV